MNGVPLTWYLILSAVLFALGIAGFLFRKNIITMFMSIELMLNAVNLTFVAFSYQLKQVNGTSVRLFRHGSSSRRGGCWSGDYFDGLQESLDPKHR